MHVILQVNFVKQGYNILRNRFLYLTNGFNLLNQFLTYDPKKRITAEAALKHVYFEVSATFILYLSSVMLDCFVGIT